MTTLLAGRKFEVLCDDSEFVLSRLKHPPDGQPTPLGRPAATRLDVATVIQTSRTIFAEILIDKLVETLMVTAVQHAGAERGLLIGRRAQEVRVEAEATTQRDIIVVRRVDTPPEP
jgi:hypothetical protein